MKGDKGMGKKGERETVFFQGEMDTLLALIVHELRQPLFSMNVLAQTALNEMEEGKDVRKRIRTIMGELKKADTLLREIRKNLYRERGREEIGMQGFLEEVVKEVKVELERRAIGFRVKYHPVEEVRGQKTKLRAVLLHLLRNSMEALEGVERGKVWLGLRGRGKGRGLEIYVGDNGRGIGEGERGEIFRPFWTKGKEGEGRGMGLAISRKIIEEHDGSLYLIGMEEAREILKDLFPGDYREIVTLFRIRLP